MAGEVTIVGKNNTKAEVTGQNELKVTLSANGEPIDSSNPLPVEATIDAGSGIATEATLEEIRDQGIGIAHAAVINPDLSLGTYSISANTYFSYTIFVLKGPVSVAGSVEFPTGSVITYEVGFNQLLGALTLTTTDPDNALVTITTLEKNS